MSSTITDESKGLASPAWGELSEAERASVIAWMREEKPLPTPPRRLVLAAATELESPTWADEAS